MKFKISHINRSLRLIIGGIIIIAAIFLFSALNIWLLVLGLIISVTGVVGFCPVNYYWHMKQLP